MTRIKTSVTLDEQLVEFLKAKAKQDNRSLSQLVETILLEKYRGEFHFHA